MDAQKLAGWMREEHEKVVELSNRLSEAVAVAPRANLGVWIKEVQTRFEHLRAHLTKHMALEETDGYLPIVTERRPGLAPEVDRLRHEHAEMSKIMSGIDTALAELLPEDRLLARDCSRRIDNLLSYIEHHEDLENNLVLSVCTQDLGTPD